MGANMTSRLLSKGHRVVAFDRHPEKVQALVAEGAVGAASLEELVEKLTPPRAVWLMVAAAGVDGTLASLTPLLARDDTIIDGGNSHYREDIRRAETLASAGVRYVDVGTSGGVWGKERGYCEMIGGDGEVVKRLDPIFAALAPSVDAAPRTPGRTGTPTPAEHGYLHCGPNGAGHFVKMVHNGIEYGVMAAYAEGLNILRRANVGKEKRPADAETAPLEEPELYRYDLDLRDIAEVWRRGSVIGSWLLDLTAQALAEHPDLQQYSGRVSDSGEGRWTASAAIESSTPAPVLTLGLGTGLGSALIVDGVLEPMELAHLPYKKGRTYEDYVGKAGLKRFGKKRWRVHVADVVTRLKATLEADDVVVGGGNAKWLRTLPKGVRLGANANAFVGGYRLWTHHA